MNATAPKARVFNDREERDHVLEATFSYDRESGLSTLAYVARHGDRLAEEFIAFEVDEFSSNEPPDVLLARFEARTFGNPLDAAPHSLLAFRIAQARRDGPQGLRHARVPKRREGEDALAYIERICTANGWPLGDGVRSMPKARQSRRDVDEQLAALREQAQAMEDA